ncbi:MAG: hypothetical protein MK479_05175 [Planctomycetes bacterium]|nr:hypothetical protein [Planctomycetota bacterium]
MSRQRKKKGADGERPGPAAEAETATENVEGGGSAGKRPLRSRLARFGVILAVQLGLLGFFYAMAAAYPAENRIHAPDSRSLPNKTVLITARILYGLPALLRSDPEEIVVRLGLPGKTPVEGVAGPSGEVTIALTAPEKPGRYQLELEADPDGATGIGPLRSSSTLEVISISKAPVKQP